MRISIISAFSLLCAISCIEPQTPSGTTLCVHSEPVPVSPGATNGDEYLYTITYTDFDFFGAGEVVKAYYDVHEASPAACSSVRNGRYYGRNLDYYINKNADFIITTTAGKDRFASIGTSADYPLCLRESILNGTLTDEDYAAIAYYMTDGINENGVAINVNVVPLDECTRTTGTNPSGPTVVTNGVVRYVLDHAESVDHAVELIRGLNLVLPSEKKFPFEEHWMISDAGKTVVVEVWNNEIVVVEDNVMTNFYLSHPDTEMGIGHERYDILKANFNEGGTLEGMHKLMKRVWYSNAYSSSIVPVWYSENLEPGCGFTWSDILAGRVDKALEIILEDEVAYGSVDEQKRLRDGTEWYTTHSIVYDLESRTMSLTAQENDTVWEFAL